MFCLVMLTTAGCADGGVPSPYLSQYQNLDDLDDLRVERTQKIVACLGEAGYPCSVVHEDGTSEIFVDDSQLEGYNKAASICLKTVCPTCGEELQTSTLTRLYHLQVEAQKCLSSEGFPTSEPPTLQTFLGASAMSRWSPHREAAQAIAASGRIDEMRNVCPDPETYVSYWE
jgi:hypothetical protein